MVISKYIEPNIKTSSNGKINDFLFEIDENASGVQSGSDILKLKDLLNKKRLFILGEPGFGKSRLLKELLKKYEEKNKKCVFIDLKKAKEGIIKYILDIQKSPRSETSIFTTTLDYYFSKNFELSNQDDIVVFLDALDEVHSDVIPSILEEVENLISIYPKISIIISCRTHHVERYKYDLKGVDFDYCELSSFSIFQVAGYLKANCDQLKDQSDKDIMDRLNQFFRDSSIFFESKSPLNTPRYLELFISLLDRKSLEELLEMTRSELYELFITERLKEESKRKEGYNESYDRKIPYIKQCFERLALIMEIQRVNVISKDDLATFEIDTKLGISNQLLLEVFYDGTLLKDRGELLEFDNTEFQEYLAAKALKRQGKTEQIVFDLAIDKRIKNIYPSWLNVLVLLIEQEPNILLPLVNFGCREHDLTLFSLIPHAKIKEIGDDEKDQIFRSIVGYHAFNKEWLSATVGEGLAAYFLPDRHNSYLFKLLEADFTIGQYINISNIVEIIREVAQRGNSLTEDDKLSWKSKILPLLKLPTQYGRSVHKSIIKTLTLIGDIDDLDLYLVELKLKEGLNDEISMFYSKVNPNHQKSIKHFISNISRNWNQSSSLVNKVNSNEGFSILFNEILEILKNRKDLKYKIIGNHNNGVFTNRLFKNLSEVLDPSLEVLVSKVVLFLNSNRLYDHNDSAFKLLEVLKNRNPRIGLLLIEQLIEHSDWYTSSSANGEILAEVISIEFFEEACGLLNSLNDNGLVIFWMVLSNKDEAVKDMFKELYPIQYQRQLEEQKKIKLKKIDRENRTDRYQVQKYTEFIESLNQEGIYTFSKYLDLNDEIKSSLRASHKLKLKKNVLSVLDNFDLTLLEDMDSLNLRFQDSIESQTINTFLNAVLLIEALDIPFQSYPQKILSAFLCTDDSEDINELLKLCSDISKEEIRLFIQNYISNTKEKLDEDKLDRFLLICQSFKAFPVAKDFLKAVVLNEKLKISYKVRVIKHLATIVKSESYFSTLFDHFELIEDTPNRDKILLSINRILIELNNESAVDWRINLVFERKYELTENINSSFTLRRKKDNEGIGSALHFVTDSKFLEKMYALLEKSFQLLQEEKGEYYKFISREIWSPVESYFRSQKKNKEGLKSYLNKLTALTKKYELHYQVYNFYYRIEKIRQEYMSLLGLPDSFGDAIKKYTVIKNKEYLTISYPIELFTMIQEIINIDLTDWVNQGFYRFIGKLNTYKGGKVEREKLIQKTIVTQLQNFLLKRGLRDVDIYREVEKLDDDKADLIINYGAVGSVMIEIKRAGNTSNPDQYRDGKFLQYMIQNNCAFGVFLLFVDKEDKKTSFLNAIVTLKKIYLEYPNIVVIGIDCLTHLSEGKS